jgi:hypothetical protein
MFKRIVVSIPQEQFPEMALKRAKYLSEMKDSKLFLSYIIEDNVFDEVSLKATHVISEKGNRDFEEKMARTHERVAKKVVLKACREILEDNPDDFSIIKGNFTESIIEKIEEKKADTLLIEYESYNLMKYRIIDRSPVPVWIERHDRPIKKIGLFCTNLSSNTRAPKAAMELKRAFNAKIDAYYINDPMGKVQEEEPGEISDQRRIKWKEIVNEKFDAYIYQKTKEEKYDLIILGRVKKRGYFHLRSKFAKKTNSSVLLVN